MDYLEERREEYLASKVCDDQMKDQMSANCHSNHLIVFFSKKQTNTNNTHKHTGELFTRTTCYLSSAAAESSYDKTTMSFGRHSTRVSTPFLSSPFTAFLSQHLGLSCQKPHLQPHLFGGPSQSSWLCITCSPPSYSSSSSSSPITTASVPLLEVPSKPHPQPHPPLSGQCQKPVAGRPP